MSVSYNTAPTELETRQCNPVYYYCGSPGRRGGPGGPGGPGDPPWP